MSSNSKSVFIPGNLGQQVVRPAGIEQLPFWDVRAEPGIYYIPKYWHTEATARPYYLTAINSITTYNLWSLDFATSFPQKTPHEQSAAELWEWNKNIYIEGVSSAINPDPLTQMVFRVNLELMNAANLVVMTAQLDYTIDMYTSWNWNSGVPTSLLTGTAATINSVRIWCTPDNAIVTLNLWMFYGKVQRFGQFVESV